MPRTPQRKGRITHRRVPAWLQAMRTNFVWTKREREREARVNYLSSFPPNRSAPVPFLEGHTMIIIIAAKEPGIDNMELLGSSQAGPAALAAAGAEDAVIFLSFPSSKFRSHDPPYPPRQAGRVNDTLLLRSNTICTTTDINYIRRRRLSDMEQGYLCLQGRVTNVQRMTYATCSFSAIEEYTHDVNTLKGL